MINNVLNNSTNRNSVPYQRVRSHDLSVSEKPAIIAVDSVLVSICSFFIVNSYELSTETAITGLRYHHTLQPGFRR